MTPDDMDCLNRIKRDGASSCAQLSNREHGIPSGPAAELEESSYRINNDRFSNGDISKEQFIILTCN